MACWMILVSDKMNKIENVYADNVDVFFGDITHLCDRPVPRSQYYDNYAVWNNNTQNTHADKDK